MIVTERWSRCTVKHALAKTKHIFLYKTIRLSSERQSRYFSTLKHAWPRLSIYISLLKTILLFCREIYAQLSAERRVVQRDHLSGDNHMVLQRNIFYTQSQPRRVLVYKNSATTFRMTILLFCREIYAQSQPSRVIVY